MSNALARKFQQFVAKTVYLVAMLYGKPPENGTASRREGYKDNATVRLIGFAANKPAQHGAVNQSNHGMMPLLQKVRQF